MHVRRLGLDEVDLFRTVRLRPGAGIGPGERCDARLGFVRATVQADMVEMVR